MAKVEIDEKVLTKILTELQAIRRKVYDEKEEKQLRPVSRKRAIKETGMTEWEIREAVKQNGRIKIGRNKYDIELLKRA